MDDNQRYEIMRTAYANIERLADERREVEPVADREDAPLRWKRLKEQSTEPPKVEPPKPEPRDRHMTKAELHAALRCHVTKAELREVLNEVAALIGRELGLTERNQLATMNAKIAALRTEIDELRARVDPPPMLKLIGNRDAA